MNKRQFSPIVLFVYNRPWHTLQTIEALQKNKLASQSELFIYSDASKDSLAVDKVNEVRSIIANATGFKDITIIEQETNQGLANSIINGVTEIVNKYEKIIVLEDDLVTSPYFLTFMNNALNFYENEKKVWHISGWNYPIDTEGLSDSFLWRTMNCWGWATWKSSWQHFAKDTDLLIEQFTKDETKRFNLDGVENFWGQVLANKEGKINTWAIYWYATIFKNKGLCLNPVKTFVNNIGHDGSGVHCGTNTVYNSTLNQCSNVEFESTIQENQYVLKVIKGFYKKIKKPFSVRLINKISRVLISKNIIQ